MTWMPEKTYEKVRMDRMFENADSLREIPHRTVVIEKDSLDPENAVNIAVDMTQAFYRETELSAADIGYTDLDEIIDNKKGEEAILVGITESLGNRSTIREGDPRIFRNIPKRDHDYSAIAVIPSVTKTERGLATPDMLEQIEKIKTGEIGGNAGLTKHYLSDVYAQYPNTANGSQDVKIEFPKGFGHNHIRFTLVLSDAQYHRLEYLFINISCNGSSTIQAVTAYVLGGDKTHTYKIWAKSNIKDGIGIVVCPSSSNHRSAYIQDLWTYNSMDKEAAKQTKVTWQFKTTTNLMFGWSTAGTVYYIHTDNNHSVVSEIRADDSFDSEYAQTSVPSYKAVKEYVDKKVTGVASSSAISTLQSKVSSLESNKLDKARYTGTAMDLYNLITGNNSTTGTKLQELESRINSKISGLSDTYIEKNGYSTLSGSYIMIQLNNYSSKINSHDQKFRTIEDQLSASVLKTGGYNGTGQTLYNLITSTKSSFESKYEMVMADISRHQSLIVDLSKKINNDSGDKYLLKSGRQTFDGHLTVTQEIYCNGNITAFSDRRLKSDLEVIPDALEKLSSVHGYTYTKNNRRMTGVVAQEIQKILPEAVVTSDTPEGYLAVDYGSLAGILIEAVKELKKQNEELERRLSYLEHRSWKGV